MCKQLNIGIIGAGNIAGKMASTLQYMESARCVAIASRNIIKADCFKNQYNIPNSYGSYEELLQDKNVDLVYIATPHSEHFKNMNLCLDYKKPVLCEKAFTSNSKEAKAILERSRQEKIFVAEAIWTRYMPMITTIKNLVYSGIIGDVKVVTGNLGYKIDEVPRLREPSLSGGALLDVGVYTINWAMMILGSQPERIESSCQLLSTGVDEQESITLFYKDNVMAVLNSTMSAISDRRGFIYGTKGFMEIYNINNYEKVTVYNNSYEEIETIIRPKQISGYEYQVESCVKALQDGEVECSDMPHSEIIKVMEVMDELRKQWGVKYPFE